MSLCKALTAATCFHALAASAAIAAESQPPPRTPPSHPIYSFAGASDGATPSGGLVRDSMGRFYGVTEAGGIANQGTVYRLTRQSTGSWSEEILHTFTGTDGTAPTGPLTFDPQGVIYGTTNRGGPGNGGVIYSLTPSGSQWTFKALHTFGPGTDGAFPYSGVVFGPEGLLYGTTAGQGTSGGGTAFAVSPTGDAVYYAKIHDFGSGLDGSLVLTRLVPFQGGFVGGTVAGGTNGLGTIFSLLKGKDGAWTEQVVYSFDFAGFLGGPSTAQGLTLHGNGKFYGCGTRSDIVKGGVFEAVAPSGGRTWTVSPIYQFGQDTADPMYSCELAIGKRGLIFGVSAQGGVAGVGGIFTLTPPSGVGQTWTEKNYITLPQGSFIGNKPVGALVHDGSNYFGASAVTHKKGPGLDFVFFAP